MSQDKNLFTFPREYECPLAQAVGTMVALLLTYAINRHWSFGRRKAL